MYVDICGIIFPVFIIECTPCLKVATHCNGLPAISLSLFLLLALFFWMSMPWV